MQMEQEVNEKNGDGADSDGNRNQVEDGYEDEDEEEDVDFNPLLKGSPSREASSSLSSEIEVLDADVNDSRENASTSLAATSAVKLPNSLQEYLVGDTDPGEEVVTQTRTSTAGEYEKGSENGSLYDKREGSASQMNIDNYLVAGEVSSAACSRKPVLDLDDEDAICMRTRARYSLASFTLDELETFLQETDDDDDLPNVDDEEEYRKFLAAVLLGGEGGPEGAKENDNVDDDDEENDADFDLEIEEALESDVDEDARYETREEVYKAATRRPKTRQNRRKKASVEGNQKLFGLSQRPLRPLLPSAPMAQRLPFSTLDGKSFIFNPTAEVPPSTADGSINGFSPHQIGQLHCLIYEHVQLLIQVFCICVLEPSRQHIAAKIQELIKEILHVHDHVLACRRLPYPSFCFFPPHVHPSVPNEAPVISPAPCVNESSSGVDVWRSCPSGNNMVPPDIRREILHNGHGLGSSFWMPYINGPILSVLDVAPLRLVGNFVDDVSAVVQEYHRRQVGLTCDTRSEREPLFPLSCLPASGSCDQLLRGDTSPTSGVAHSSSRSVQTPKKTLASALVERAKRQSVALVPKEIVEVAQRFYPLFNPALYPHKPPPASVANRVLFTDAEDELLALGLMEYNTDWKAIQQRFLPCKSKHQIFVRQKNRSSSKAPENPIKAVRRTKNSPLTAEEVAHIEEGLKIFKLDWMSIWKFIVPYRDPSLLPRQWRIANGTQKSYKCDASKKAKRQLYERNRRASKSATLAHCQTSPEKEDNSTDKVCGDNNNVRNQTDREEEAFVHEAFLADWRPGTSSQSPGISNLQQQQKSPIRPPRLEGSQVSEQLNRSGSGGAQAPSSNEFPAARRSFSSQVFGRPYRARRVNNARVVKIAPDLPPLNLPSSARVMSQSAFKSYQGRAAPQPSRADSSDMGLGAEAGVEKVVKHTVNSGVYSSEKAEKCTKSLVKTNTSNHQPQDSLVIRNRHVSEERDESDLQMHPLLFRSPEDGHFPYYPLHSSASTSRSFNFFAGSPPQLNLSLFHNPRHANSAFNFLAKSLKTNESASSSRFDFHPLLQRSEDVNSSSVASANLVTAEGRCTHVQNPLGGINNSSSASAVSPCQKINELDLDIRLSSTSRQHKAIGSVDVNECGTAASVANATNSRNPVSLKPKGSVKHSGQQMPIPYAPDKTVCNLDAGVHEVVVASDEGNRSNVDNTEDQPLPEIVMEQEELSDSEDEAGEKVEFECEEMADSDAEEGSDSEQMADMQNEDVEKADADAKSNDEPITYDDPQGNAFQPAESRLMDKKANHSSSTLSLNLNSCPPASPLMNPNDENLKGRHTSPDSKLDSSATEATENISTNDANAMLQKQAINLEAQPNLSSGVTASKKPRKRAGSPDFRSLRGTPKRRNVRLKTNPNPAKSKD